MSQSVYAAPGDVATLFAFDPHAGEVFQPHPRYAHLMVSDHGRVWSQKAKRFVGYQSGPRGGELSPNPYLRVNVGGTPRTQPLHVLVLETFVGPRPTPEHEGDHKNFDSLDNRVENLQWLTADENNRRRRDADLDPRDLRNDTAWTGSTYGV